MTTISFRQSRAARALLGLTQAELSKLSQVSIARVTAFENGSDCLVSTADRITAALEAHGAVFEPSGAVNVVPQASSVEWPPGMTREKTMRAAALEVINWNRSLAGRAPLVDGDDCD